MVLQDNGKGNRDAKSGRRMSRVPYGDLLGPLLETASKAVKRVCGSLRDAGVQGLRAAAAAIAPRLRIVVQALSPRDSANMDAQKVFRIRRTAVIAGVVAIALVAAIVAATVHVNRSARAGKAKAANTAQAGMTKRQPSAGAAKKAKKTTARNASRQSQAKGGKVASGSVSANSEAGEPQKRLEALAASISSDESAKIQAQADETARQSGESVVQYTYCIAGKGDVGSLEGFANTVYRVLNDPRGWPRAGATFVKSDADACDFTVVLSEARYMTTFDSGCSEDYSCRVGGNVIINRSRWDNGVDHWMKAGGDLARYRTMVINHEVGHALGHDDNENTCAGDGQPAPLMQEQSMHLDGCKVNEWPLDIELWKS